MARHMKALEKENVRLKKLVAEQALDNQILKEAARRRARRGVPQGHAPRRVNLVPVGHFRRLARRIAAPATKSTPTSSNMPAASNSANRNCHGRLESDAAWLISALTEAGSGYNTASNRPTDGLWASTDPRNGLIGCSSW